MPDAPGEDVQALREALQEAELLLAALTYYAPHSSVAVNYFSAAHRRACDWLVAHSTLSPNEIRAGLLAYGEPPR